LLYNCRKGDFDDAQAIVKAAFADEKFRDEVKLGAINSINWARVLAQITYYFFAWLQVTNENKDNSPVNFAVPTGNFGDILAGYYAKRMGLPVDKLIICTNQNDVLHRFFNTGIYQKVQAVLTIAPSMDISVSSNFERYLFYLSGEAPETLASWMNIFEKTGEVTLPMEMLNAARKDFLSAKSDKDGIISTMRTTFCRENYLVCPHTATAVDGILKLKLPAERTVCLATAHPAKFEEAVNLALSAEVELPERPKELQDLFDLKTRRILFPKSLETIENYIKSKKSNSRMWMTLPLILTSVAVITIGLYAYVRVKK
jgi:threonine synthase